MKKVCSDVKMIGKKFKVAFFLAIFEYEYEFFFFLLISMPC